MTGRYGVIAATLPLFVATALGSCVNAPTPDQMSRTTLETAPADLQLLCANAVAKADGVASAKVLPVSSRKLDVKNYQVELDAGGKKTSCIIDQEGNVTSVQSM